MCDFHSWIELITAIINLKNSTRWYRFTMPDLSQKQRDTLLVLRYRMNYPVDGKAIETLKLRGYIEDKLEGGWLVTSAGRECVRKLK